MGEFSFRTRKAELDNLEGSEFQVLIIGGGIIGAGVANVLAQAGVSVLLAEKNDFASGTSSGSSKMIHGGLRYLSQGRIRLTKHLLSERNYLLENTELVRPLGFRILIGKKQWPRYQISFGLLLYRILGGGRHSGFTRNKGEFPKEISGSFRYSDAVTDDARLTVLNVLSARNHGATCFNYLAYVRETAECEYELEDSFTGRSFMVKARVVINCAGPWAATVIPEVSAFKGRMKISRGIHLIFPSELYPGNDAVVFRSPLDGRQLFLIPRGEVIILGTTDIFVDSPDSFTVPESEKDYLIQSVRQLFPQFTGDRIIAEYSGIRSLFGRGKTPGKMSRDYKAIRSGNKITVFGGKVTDYRRVAREVSADAMNILSLQASLKGFPTLEAGKVGFDMSVESAIFNQCALTLEDVIKRRTGAFFFSIDNGKEVSRQFRKLVDEKNLRLVNSGGYEHLE